jgi:hypothetical protein
MTPVDILPELHSEGTFGRLFLTLETLEEFICTILHIIFPLGECVCVCVGGGGERERERENSLTS